METLAEYTKKINEPATTSVNSNEPAAQTTFYAIGGNATTLVNYALTGLHFNPSRGILLLYANYVVWIKGRNLSSLFADLQAQKIRELKAEPERYQSNDASETNQPVITAIETRFISLSAFHGCEPDDLFNEIEQAKANAIT